MLTIALTFTFLALATAAVAHSGPAPRGGDDVRARWLEHRLAYHRYVVEHGAGRHRAWHRRALVWTGRELRETLAAIHRREWAPPPEPFLSIARCEQRDPNGLYGVNWQAYSETYEGAYGFVHSTWSTYAPPGYPDNAANATIRQQTHVAKILVRTFGGYSSWPTCGRRLGLPQ